VRHHQQSNPAAATGALKRDRNLSVYLAEAEADPNAPGIVHRLYKPHGLAWVDKSRAHRAHKLVRAYVGAGVSNFCDVHPCDRALERLRVCDDYRHPKTWVGR